MYNQRHIHFQFCWSDKELTSAPFLIFFYVFLCNLVLYLIFFFSVSTCDPRKSEHDQAALVGSISGSIQQNIMKWQSHFSSIKYWQHEFIGIHRFLKVVVSLAGRSLPVMLNRNSIWTRTDEKKPRWRKKWQLTRMTKIIIKNNNLKIIILAIRDL